MPALVPTLDLRLERGLTLGFRVPPPHPLPANPALRLFLFPAAPRGFVDIENRF